MNTQKRKNSITPLFDDWETFEQLICKYSSSYNIDSGSDYGEPGYMLSPDSRGVLLGNWNAAGKYDSLEREENEKRLKTILNHVEKHWDLEWCDEWIVLYEEDSEVYRTSPDSYSWTSSIWECNGEYSSYKIAEEYPEDYLADRLDDPNQANTLLPPKTLELWGFKCMQEEYESGWYGTEDDPHKILKKAEEIHPGSTFLFSISNVEQFRTCFTLWVRSSDWEPPETGEWNRDHWEYPLDLSIMDVCTPDYFQGCAETDSQTVINVPVYSDTSPQDLLKAIRKAWGDHECSIPNEDIDSESAALLSIWGDSDQSSFANAFGIQYSPTLADYESDECLETVYMWIRVSIPEGVGV